MAFSGAGTFNRLYTWVTDRINGVPITDTRMDAEMDGFATGLSTCITKDGQTTTTARIPLAAGASLFDGSVGTPALNFTSDIDTGIYRIGANNIGVAVNGAKVLDISTTGLSVTGTMTGTGSSLSLNGDVVVTHPLTPTPDHDAGTNIGIGKNALVSLVPIHNTEYLTFAGFNSGAALVTGNHITAVGAYALASYSNADGSGGNGIGTSVFGVDSGRALTGGISNSFFGEHTATTATSMNYTSLFGNSAGYQQSGDYTTAFGYFACSGTITGSYNTGVGPFALSSATGVAGSNAAFGPFAGSAITTGSNNICIGSQAGATAPTTGSGNILIGTAINATAAGTNNYLSIGDAITGTLGSSITVAKVTITKPATGSTLTIPDGVTLTGPAASGTAMTLGNAETITGVKTFGSAGAVSKLKIAGTTSGAITLDATAVAGTGTLTLPAETGTLVTGATTKTLTNTTYDTAGTGNSFSINGVAATANTGTGSVVRASSPTITTASLAANSFNPLTNVTGAGVQATGGFGGGVTLSDTNFIGIWASSSAATLNIGISGTTGAGWTTGNTMTFSSSGLINPYSMTLASGTAVPAGGTAGLGLKMSSTSNLGVFFGSGAPTLSAAQGSLYLRTDGSSTSTRLYVNTTGSTTWTNVTTAA